MILISKVTFINVKLVFTKLITVTSNDPDIIEDWSDSVVAKLKNPILEVTLRCETNAPVKPGSVLQDRHHNVYRATTENEIELIKREDNQKLFFFDDELVLVINPF